MNKKLAAAVMLALLLAGCRSENSEETESPDQQTSEMSTSP